MDPAGPESDVNKEAAEVEASLRYDPSSAANMIEDRDRREQYLRDNAEFPSPEGAMSLLCSLPARLIQEHLPSVLPPILDSLPGITADFLIHACTGWRMGAYLPFLDDSEGGKAAGKSGGSRVSEARTLTLLFSRFKDIWAKVYSQLRATWHIIDHDISYSEFDIFNENVLPTRDDMPPGADGKPIEYIPLAPLIPYLVNFVVSCPNTERQMKHQSILKRVLICVTGYGIGDGKVRGDIELVRVPAPKGVTALPRSHVTEGSVHTLIEIFLQEIDVAREKGLTHGIDFLLEEENPGLTAEAREKMMSDELSGDNRMDVYAARTIYMDSAYRLQGVLHTKLNEEEAVHRDEIQSKYTAGARARDSVNMGIESPSVNPLFAGMNTEGGEEKPVILPYNGGHVLHLASIYHHPPTSLAVFQTQGDLLSQLRHHMSRGRTESVLETYYNTVQLTTQRRGPRTAAERTRPDAQSRSVPYWDDVVRYLVVREEFTHLTDFLGKLPKTINPLAMVRVLAGAGVSEYQEEGREYKEGTTEYARMEAAKTAPLSCAAQSLSQSFDMLRTGIQKATDNIGRLENAIETEMTTSERITGTPKSFECLTCDKCRERLDLPAFHFCCGHSMHKRCILHGRIAGKRVSTSKNPQGGQKASEDTLCPICEPVNAQLLEQRKTRDGLFGMNTAGMESLTFSSFEDVAGLLGKRPFAHVHFSMTK